KGIPSPLGAFDNRRTFTSIENMKFIISRLLECKVESGVYNVADDDAISINALVEEMCLAMGRKPRIWRIPRALVKAVAKIGDFIHLPLNTDRLEKLTENYVASNAKIKRALGIDSLPVKAHDGVRLTVESFSKKP
ncbi:MAG: nucleoside-diphosphate-sugar epimerase, partial [Bacteroidales bacterium]|nr:nucleoside-diphosphate-sugar epimerase [Bacteroidales bacterium]